LAASALKEVVVTNTITLPPEKWFDKLTVLSVSALLGEAIQRVHSGSSVSTAYRSAGAVQTRLSLVSQG
jgi:ribose-phosphate pyrophosphokinase